MRDIGAMRYRWAIKRGCTEEQAAWLRDNDPDRCTVHPDRPSKYKSKRRCEECCAKAKAASIARENAKVIDCICARCKRPFQCLKRVNRANCPDCHAAPGTAKLKKVQPVIKPMRPAPVKPEMPATWEKPYIEPKAKAKPVAPDEVAPLYGPIYRHQIADSRWTDAAEIDPAKDRVHRDMIERRRRYHAGI